MTASSPVEFPGKWHIMTRAVIVLESCRNCVTVSGLIEKAGLVFSFRELIKYGNNLLGV